nr:MAG: hypothetical protein 2 [Leviviridae sp.]
MSIVTKNAAGTNVTYNVYRKETNRANYIGPTHSDILKDTLVITSVPPKSNGTTYGNRRSSANYLVTITTSNPDGTSSAKDMKVEVAVSLPAGATFATLKEALARIAGTMTDDAVATDLYHIGKIDR